MFGIGMFSGQLNLIERRRIPRRLVRGQAKLLCRYNDDAMNCLIRIRAWKVLARDLRSGLFSLQRLILLGIKNGSTVFEATPM